MLEPGDRNIVRIEPWRWRQRDEPWTCSRCRGEHPPAESWEVHYRTDDDRELNFVICGSCAEVLTPTWPVVDVAALEERGTLPELTELVRRVAAMRSTGGDRIEIRTADLVAIAERQHRTVVDLVLDLHEAGALVSLERS